MVFWGMGFGGRALPLVYSRVASWFARASQTLMGTEETYIQLCMDDAAIVAGARLNLVLIVLLRLVFGRPVRWHKGELTTGEPLRSGPPQEKHRRT